jgi:hypothetical protein
LILNNKNLFDLNTNATNVFTNHTILNDCCKFWLKPIARFNKKTD